MRLSIRGNDYFAFIYVLENFLFHSAGDAPVFERKTFPKWLGCVNPHAAETSFTLMAVLERSSEALSSLMFSRYCFGEMPCSFMKALKRVVLSILIDFAI